jgi:hypothetical protein
LDTITPEEMEIDRVSIDDYKGSFDDSPYDFLMYNSFASELNPLKFIKENIYPADDKYHKFNRKKLLLDSHDDGTLDGFERFNDKVSPRIKYTPGYEFAKEYNVIGAIPIKIRGFHLWNGEQKKITLVFSGNKKGFFHNIREVVDDRIRPFKPYEVTIRSKGGYAEILKRTKISVACPGWGLMGSAHNEALAAKAVLFSYETVKKVKLLPFSEMVDGENCVLFNLENLEDKLSYLLANEDEIKRIAENGRKAFDEGYLPRKTAELILNYFKGE